jgi:hypothetical protein
VSAIAAAAEAEKERSLLAKSDIKKCKHKKAAISIGIFMLTSMVKTLGRTPTRSAGDLLGNDSELENLLDRISLLPRNNHSITYILNLIAQCYLIAVMK